LTILPPAAQGADAGGMHDRARIRPKALVPPLATAPTIDGVLAPGEWNTLHVARWVSRHGDLLQPRMGEFWLGCDGRRLFVAARSAVHPTLGTQTTHRAREGEADAEYLEMDDSIEIWVSALGGAGPSYQMIVNPAGAVFDAAHAGGSVPSRTDWTAAIEQRHTVKDGVWVMEMAVTCESLGIADPSAPLAIRVCRNYCLPRDQSRWAPGVDYYSVPMTMPIVVFASPAPVVSEVGLDDAEGICLAIDVSNPGGEPLPLVVRFGHNARKSPRAYAPDEELSLAPGETRRILRRWPWAQAADAVALGEILVKSPRGTTYYHRDFGWHPRQQAPLWEEPAASPQAPGTPATPAAD
jgi:hypothetical protein